MNLQRPPLLTMLNKISELTPGTNGWTICARATHVYTSRTYNGKKGAGKLFNVDLLDSTGEIRAVGYNAQCEAFFPILKEGELYVIHGGFIRSTDPQYVSVKHPYEITFNGMTTITPCQDDGRMVPVYPEFQFIKFKDIPLVPKKRIIDVIGVIEQKTVLQTVTVRKTQQTVKKRDIHLVDETHKLFVFTIWGNQAEEFPENAHASDIIMIRGCNIGAYNGQYTLSSGFNTYFRLNPAIPETEALVKWFRTEYIPAKATPLAYYPDD